MKEVCEQLSKRLEMTSLELATLMSTTGMMVEPTLAPLTRVLLAIMVELLLLIWFQFLLDTQSGVLTQMR